MSPAPDERIAQELAEEVIRTRRTVGALGQAIYDAHVPASPALAASVQAELNLYEQIADEFGLLTSAQAGEKMGSRSPAPRNLALAAQRDGRLLALWRGNCMLVPGFQFADEGLRPAIRGLIELGRTYDRSERGLITWLMSPTTYLDGKRPVDVIDDPATLLNVARAAFGAEW